MNNTGPLPEIRHTITINAPFYKVWEAVATSEGLGAWFMKNDMKPEVGNQFHLQAGPFGESPCTVTLIEPRQRLSIDWGKDWTLTFDLSDLGGSTEFTLVHGGWRAEEVTEMGESHQVVRDRMDQGWAGLVKKLAAYVES